MFTFIYDILSRLKHSKIMLGDCSGEELRNRFSVPSLFEVSTLLFLARTTLKYHAFEYPTTCRDWSKSNNYSKVFVYIERTPSFEGLELWLRLWWWKLKVSAHSVMKIVLMEANFDRTYIDTNHQVDAGISSQYFSERDLFTPIA